jgi:hypothetical protein
MMLCRISQLPILCVTLVCSAQAPAQEAGSISPFKLLNDQTVALYHQVSLGVLRVQLPTHHDTTLPTASDPLAPWSDKLTPEMRARLEQSRPPGVGYNAALVPNPGPTTAATRQVVIFSPNVVGVVVNSDGYALLPLYASKEDVGNHPLPVMLCDGSTTEARFVGSDEKTNVTVVQVPHSAVKPLMFTTGPPDEGSYVMVMSMDPSATQLKIWTRWANNWGLVIRSTDGAVAGFSQRGRFLGAGVLSPVVRQIIAHGSVSRPRLPPDDPQRQFVIALGNLPAIRITGVILNSPAARAGLQAGDLILAFGKQSVADPAAFAAAIAAASSGPNQMQILRQDQLISVTVDLEAVLP